jgi:hypothetical protein
LFLCDVSSRSEHIFLTVRVWLFNKLVL